MDNSDLHEIACDLPALFGRASLEGHEAGQRLAAEVQAKLRASLAQQGEGWSDALPVTPPPVVESSLWIDSRALERVAASGAAQVNLYRSKPSHRYDRQHVPLFTHPAAVDASAIIAAYKRGAEWALENGPICAPYLDKAARDYADKTAANSGVE